MRNPVRPMLRALPFLPEVCISMRSPQHSSLCCKSGLNKLHPLIMGPRWHWAHMCVIRSLPKTPL